MEASSSSSSSSDNPVSERTLFNENSSVIVLEKVFTNLLAEYNGDKSKDGVKLEISDNKDKDQVSDLEISDNEDKDRLSDHKESN